MKQFPDCLIALALPALIAAAALAFGGTHLLVWPLVQLSCLLLALLLIWSKRPQELRWLPWKGPVVLLSFFVLHAFMTRPPGYLVRQQFLRLLALSVVFWLSAWVASSPLSSRRFLRCLMGLGLFESLCGLTQYLTGWQRIFSYDKVFYTSQATGTFINPNHYAGLLEMLLPFAVVGALQHREGPTGSKIWHAVEDALPAKTPPLQIRRIGYFILAIALFGAILASGSRSATISAVVSCFWLGWISGVPATGSRTRRPYIFLIAGFILFGVWIGVRPLLDRYSGLGVDLHTRLAIWKDTATLILARPWLGSGLGTFPDSYTRVQTALLDRTIDHAHNDYLEVAVEWGLPGTVLLFGLIFYVWHGVTTTAFRQRTPIAVALSASLLAMLSHSLTDFNLQIPANALLFAAILGLASRARRGPAPEDCLGSRSSAPGKNAGLRRTMPCLRGDVRS